MICGDTLHRTASTQPLAGPRWEEIPVKALQSFSVLVRGVYVNKRVGDKWVKKPKHELVESLKSSASVQPIDVWEQLAFRSMWSIALLFPGFCIYKRLG